MPFLPGGSLIEVDGTLSDVTDDGSPIRLHPEVARERSIARWRDKPAFQAWLASYAEEFQDIELVLWDVLVLRFPDYAEGEALNMLGRIVGVARGKREDGPYRARIKAQIAINASQGRPNDVIEILRLISDVPFRLVEQTGGFLIEYTEPLPAEVWTEIPSVVRDSRAAGVGANTGAPFPNANGSLRWGFSAANPGHGGRLGDDPARPSVGDGLADFRRT